MKCQKIVRGFVIACAAVMCGAAMLPAMAEDIAISSADGAITVTVAADVVAESTPVHLVWDATDKGEALAGWAHSVKLGDVTAAGGTFPTTGAAHSIPDGAAIRAFVVSDSDIDLLDYIQSSGTQYIDTGIVGALGDVYEAKFAFVSQSKDNAYVAGEINNTSGADKGRYQIILRKLGGELLQIVGGTGVSGQDPSVSPNYTTTLGTFYTVVSDFTLGNRKLEIYNAEKSTLLDSDAETTIVRTELYNPNNDTIYLFAANVNGSTNYMDRGNLKISSFKLTRGGTVVKNLVAAKNGAAVGMVDLASGNEFHPNKGASNFIAGSVTGKAPGDVAAVSATATYDAGEEPPTPPPTPTGDWVGLFPDFVHHICVVAPCSQQTADVYNGAKAKLEEAGYTVTLSPEVTSATELSAAQKAANLTAAWQNTDYDLIIAIRGGLGGENTFAQLDPSALTREVPFIGFSNISCLLNPLEKCGVKQLISGPSLGALYSYPVPKTSRDLLCKLVAKEPVSTSVQLTAKRALAKVVTGKPLGGHWPSIALNNATDLPDCTGRIVFLEIDSGYNLANAKSNFDSLKGKWNLDDAAAIVVAEVLMSGSPDEMIQYITDNVTCPVYSGYPMGHQKGGVDFFAVDFGRYMTITPEGVVTYEDADYEPPVPTPAVAAKVTGASGTVDEGPFACTLTVTDPASGGWTAKWYDGSAYTLDAAPEHDTEGVYEDSVMVMADGYLDFYGTGVVKITAASVPPTATMGADTTAFTTADVAWRVNSIGSPADSATAEIEYADDPTFADAASVTVGTDIADPNTEGAVTLTELEPNTTYYARVKVTTDKGAVGYSPTATFSTKSAPCDFSAVAFASGTVSTTLTRLDDGATVSVTLLVNGQSAGSWTPTAAGTVLSQAVAVSGETTFRFQWTATQGAKNASGFVEQTVSSAAMLVLAPATAADVATALSGATVLRIGDVCKLPGTDEDVVYQLGDNSTARIEGRTITALKSGALVVRTLTITHKDVAGHVFTTNVLSSAALIVIPDPEDAPGGIWIARPANGAFDWTDATKWIRLSGSGDYPNGEGAWAIITANLAYNKTLTVTLPSAGVTVGGLVTFDYGSQGTMNGPTWFSFAGGQFTFRQVAGKKAVWRLAGQKSIDSIDGYSGRVKFLAGAPVVFESDAVIDYMRGKSTQTAFYDDIDIGANTVETTNGGGGNSPNDTVQQGFTIRKDLKGTGTFIHHANGQAGFDDMTSTPLSFEGTLVAGAGDQTRKRNGKHGGFFLDGAQLSNAKKLVVEGAWNGAYAKTPGALFLTGADDKYTFWGTEFIDPLPPVWTLAGGQMNINAPGKGVTRTEYSADDFTIKGPSGQLSFPAPVAGTVTTTVKRVSAATSMAKMNSYGNATKNGLILSTSPAEAREESDDEEFLPFFYALSGWQYGPRYFRNKTSGLVRADATKLESGLAADKHCAVYSAAGGSALSVSAGGLSIRSLQFGTAYGRSSIVFAQAGDVLKVTGGLVQLNNCAALASPANANSAASLLDLGDKVGYLTTYAGFDVPVGCRLGANGLVLGGNGRLQYAGDASGTLSNGVHVTSGTLQLGYVDNETLYPANLGKNDITVEAGAKLEIVSAQPFTRSVNLALGAAEDLGAYGKVDLGANATVKRCSVNGEYLTRGTWGATGSGADNVNDDLFSGSGVLSVTKDGKSEGLILFIR